MTVGWKPLWGATTYAHTPTGNSYFGQFGTLPACFLDSFGILLSMGIAGKNPGPVVHLNRYRDKISCPSSKILSEKGGVEIMKIIILQDSAFLHCRAVF